VRAAIVETEPALESRLVIGKPRATEEGEEAAVPMEVALTAAATPEQDEQAAEAPRPDG
jgi:hypothetical protein